MAGVVDRKGLVIDPEPPGHARGKVVQHHVGMAHQFVEELEPGAGLEVDGHRPLVAVEGEEVGAHAVDRVGGVVLEQPPGAFAASGRLHLPPCRSRDPRGSFPHRAPTACASGRSAGYRSVACWPRAWTSLSVWAVQTADCIHFTSAAAPRARHDGPRRREFHRRKQSCDPAHRAVPVSGFRLGTSPHFATSRSCSARSLPVFSQSRSLVRCPGQVSRQEPAKHHDGFADALRMIR